MSVSRKDNKHNADLVNEISDSFNRAMDRKKDGDPGHDADEERAAPRFRVTGDQRVPPERPR
ncbi:MAG: hypothetical protein ACRDQB_11110 [Thermocrispum sp.]